jgi:D-galactarolactone cycloisomerase
MTVGLGVKEDTKNIKAVREAIGPDVDLMIDANHAYSLKEAIQLALAVEQYNISWFEEPVSPENYDCYAELRTKTTIPIAGGECEHLCAGFLNLFQKRCVDIAQPDICAAGGLTEVKKIACLAELFGVEIVLHTWGSGIGIAAALQLLSNLDITPGRLHEPELLLELDRTTNPLRDGLFTPHFNIEKDIIRVPNSPGLGVDIDEELFKKYLLK